MEKILVAPMTEKTFKKIQEAVKKDIATVSAVKPAIIKITDDAGGQPLRSKGEKKVTIDVSAIRPIVTFTGGLWTAMEIKVAYAAMKRGFREMQRDLYRKEYEKK